ncbi:hypothetical protein V1477_013835 [Vespula maculifrons]|uniref:Uncharacterized protein n=1 Tax=Vespula maculifrons TaxID=7453 RepID=A0ABD2BQV8_VESMC
MDTRLRWRKENLFLDGKIIEDCLPTITNYELLHSHGQGIRSKHTNLKQSFIYKNSLPEPVTWTVRPLYRVFTEK